MARHPQNAALKLRIVRGGAGTLARRDEILVAAIRVIARDGLSQTTLEKVAELAGISPGTVTFHFAKKDALLLAVLDRVSDEFERARRAAIIGAGGDPVAALGALVAATFDPAVSDPDRVAVWYAFWGEANARRIYLDRVGSLDKSNLADLLGLCRQLIDEGGYAHLDAEAVAITLAGLIEYLWQGILVDGRRFDRRAAIRQARAYLSVVFPRHFG